MFLLGVVVGAVVVCVVVSNVLNRQEEIKRQREVQLARDQIRMRRRKQVKSFKS